MEKPCVFYQVSELADCRWNLTEKDIFHAAIKEELQLAIYWDGSYFQDNRPGTYLNQYVFLKPEHIHGLLIGYHASLDGGIEVSEAETKDGRKVTLARQPSRTLDEDYDEIEDREHTWYAPIIPKEKIVILSGEVEMYETLHPDIKQRKQPDNGENQRCGPGETKRTNTLLKIIGGFLKITYLSETKQKYCYTRDDGSPNVNKVVEQFLSDLRNEGFKDDGIKERTIRGLIKKAVEEIMENKE